jgi:precorrin-2/cobalt-factor-2 C20-methyltransferase
LYGIGVGPGDPDWITVKGAKILAACRHVCAPKSRLAADSVALEIARPHLRADAVIHEMEFPMSADEAVLEASWRRAAGEVHDLLAAGEDCCFLTLGDALLYSTYIFLVRELRRIAPQIDIVTVPGVTAFAAAAALTGFAIGEKKQLVTIVPASDDMAQFTRALDGGGTVVLMKVGRRLPQVLAELDRRRLLDRAVFVSHAGLPQQRVETDLGRLRDEPEETGYLSILLIHAGECNP